MTRLPASNPDGPMKLRSGETPGEAMSRLVAAGITLADITYEARLRFAAMPKPRQFTWLQTYHSVLEDWDATKFPRPAKAPAKGSAAPVSDAMAKALQEAADL